MLVAATSSSMGPMILNPTQITPIKTQTTASSAKQPASSSTATSSPATTSGTTASAPAISSDDGHGHVSSGGGGGASASAAAEVETLAGTYTTTVGGTQYSGSVEEENGSYTASVPNVSGATATGATLMEAENNLTIRIDELV